MADRFRLADGDAHRISFDPVNAGRRYTLRTNETRYTHRFVLKKVDNRCFFVH